MHLLQFIVYIIIIIIDINLSKLLPFIKLINVHVGN